MTCARTLMLGDRVARDLKQPRGKSLLVAQAREAALDPHEYVLQHVVDLGRRDPPRDERANPFGDVLPERGLDGHAQQLGPQHALAPPGLRASIVADAINFSIPGSQPPTISALRGAILTSTLVKPA